YWPPRRCRRAGGRRTTSGSVRAPAPTRTEYGWPPRDCERTMARPRSFGLGPGERPPATEERQRAAAFPHPAREPLAPRDATRARRRENRRILRRAPALRAVALPQNPAASIHVHQIYSS